MRPTSLGLTGQLFLNTVYEDPKTNPPLPIRLGARNPPISLQCPPP